MGIEQGIITSVDTLSAKEAAVTQVRNAVESILRIPTPWDKQTFLKTNEGMLSTAPDRVHPEVGFGTFNMNCGAASSEINKFLRLNKSKSNVSHAKTESKVPYDHVYIVVDTEAGDVIVEPTLGQFVLGHNHIFVGTRDHLRDVVTRQTGIGGHYSLRTEIMYLKPENMFNIIWGKESTRLPKGYFELPPPMSVFSRFATLRQKIIGLTEGKIEKLPHLHARAR